MIYNLRMRIGLLSFFLLLNLVCPDVANAGFYEVKIKPITPAGGEHIATCSDEYEKCHLTLVLEREGGDAGNQGRYINVIIRFEDGYVYFHFIRNGKYLATTASGHPYFNAAMDEGIVSRRVVLYTPHPLQEEDDADILQRPVLRLSNERVAELEISVTLAGF